MKRTIGLCCWDDDSSVKEKIKKAAPEFEVITLGRNCTAEELERCEILFGVPDPKWIPAAKNLRWLHTQSAGVDRYFRNGATFPENVMLTNSSGAFGVAISEHLLTMAMMLQHRMTEYWLNQQKHVWRSVGKVGSLYGSDVAVIGLGNIGSNFAERVYQLGAHVTGVVRTEKKERPPHVDKLLTQGDINEAIRDADIVALCLPETAETIGIFGQERFEALKSGAILLNVGRGSAIDEGALIRALESGRLGGAGLDVTATEPLPKDSKLWDFENVIITPHVSGDDSLALTGELIAARFIKYLGDYIAGRPFERVVDKRAGY